MNRSPAFIVAVFARGRELGFALFDGAELLRFGVRSIRGARRGATFEKRVADVLDALVRLAGSDARFVLEANPPPSAEKGGLNRALRVAVEVRFDKNAVYGVSLADAKRLFYGCPSATQANLIAAVAERHPACRMPDAPLRPGVKPYGLAAILAVAFAETACRKRDAPHRAFRP
jgi:hypothetical protein